MNNLQAKHTAGKLKNLEGAEAFKKIKELAEKAECCFFCSNIKTGLPISARPMVPQKIDDNGDIWFLSLKDSEKNHEIQHDPFVQLFFQESAHSGFLSVYGTAEISEDKQKIAELWNPALSVWFTGGKDDRRISVIRISPTQGYYWDTRHGAATALLPIVTDDSIEGRLET